MRPKVADPGEQVEQTLAFLRRKFSRLSDADREDIAQGAYEALLRAERGGEVIESPAAYLRAVAWRDAVDLLESRKIWARQLVDDAEGERILAVPSADPDAEAQLELRAEMARGLEAVEQLPPRSQAVYRLCTIEGTTIRGAAQRLGLSRSVAHRSLRAATDAVIEARASESLPPEIERLVSRYVVGVATSAERRRVERLLRSDPTVAALARELGRYHAGVGAMVPPSALVGSDSHVGPRARRRPRPPLRDRVGGGPRLRARSNRHPARERAGSRSRRGRRRDPRKARGLGRRRETHWRLPRRRHHRGWVCRRRSDPRRQSSWCRWCVERANAESPRERKAGYDDGDGRPAPAGRRDLQPAAVEGRSAHVR